MSRFGVLETQLITMLATVHHPLRCGIVAYLVILCHVFHSIPLDVCSVSQLERCFSVSLHELILSCSIFDKIDPSRDFPFLSFVMLDVVLKARRQDQYDALDHYFREEQLGHEDSIRLVSPLSSYLTS